MFESFFSRYSAKFEKEKGRENVRIKADGKNRPYNFSYKSYPT